MLLIDYIFFTDFDHENGNEIQEVFEDDEAVAGEGITVLDLTLLGGERAVSLRAVAYLQGCCLGCSRAKLELNPVL